MMLFQTSASRIALILTLGLLSAPAHSQSIGTAGAVNPDATSAPPGGTLRTMNVGGNVVYKERINTSSNGSVQLLFVDRTTLNVGPNSQLTIDEFVFDPSTNTGRIAATLTKGVMRFVGGQTSHTGGATIKTPATTLGVRGGVVTVRHDAQNGTRAINHFGVMTAQTQNGTEVIRRPGFALSVQTTQSAPTSPVRAPQTEIDGNNRQMTSAGGQTGGRSQVPTDEGASKIGVGQTNAPVAPTLVQGQQQTTAQSAQLTSQPAAAQSFVVTQQVQQVSSLGSQQATTQVIAQTAAATAAATKVVTLPPKRAYVLEGGTGSNGLPVFIPSGFVATGTVFTSKAGGYGFGGANADGTPNNTSRVLAAGASINGVGSAQNSAIYVMTADIFPETPTAVPGGGFVATTRRAAGFSMGRANGAVTPLADGMTFDANVSPTSITFNQDDSSGNVRTPSTAFYYPGGQAGGGTNYTFSGSVTRGVTPAGFGDNRPVTTLEGFVGGLVRTFSNATGSSTGPTGSIYGNVLIDLTDSSRFGANITAVKVGRQGGAAATVNDDFLIADLAMGYQGTGTRSRSAYVDYSAFGAREAATSTDASLSTVTTNNSAFNPSLPISASNYPQKTAAILSESNLMVTSDAVNAKSFFPGVSFCQCDYTRWGFWSMDVRRTGTTAAGTVDPSVQDLLHMGTWVAGVTAKAVDIPTQGIATYAGHAIGSFKTGSNEYLAAGNFSHTVNFGANSGTYAINNLDGRNYAGTSAIQVTNSYNPVYNRSYFAGSGATNAGPTATMFINGAFMQGAASPVGEMGGVFNVTGSNYIGSGTFAAKR